MIETGNIIKNLSPTEAVVIDKIRKLGSKYSLSYTGVNTNKRGSKILDEQQMSTLEVLTSDGEFNFNLFYLLKQSESTLRTSLTHCLQSTVVLSILYLTRWKLFINIFYHSPKFAFFSRMTQVLVKQS